MLDCGGSPHTAQVSRPNPVSRWPEKSRFVSGASCFPGGKPKSLRGSDRSEAMDVVASLFTTEAAPGRLQKKSRRAENLLKCLDQPQPILQHGLGVRSTLSGSATFVPPHSSQNTFLVPFRPIPLRRGVPRTVHGLPRRGFQRFDSSTLPIAPIFLVTAGAVRADARSRCCPVTTVAS